MLFSACCCHMLLLDECSVLTISCPLIPDDSELIKCCVSTACLLLKFVVFTVPSVFSKRHDSISVALVCHSLSITMMQCPTH